jgi:cysteine-rich repeat protein
VSTTLKMGMAFRYPSMPAPVSIHVKRVIECGDGEIEGGETCDDGNADAGDGCSATCTDEGPV